MSRFLSLLFAAALPLTAMACAEHGDTSEATGTGTAHVEATMSSSDQLLAQTLMRQILTQKLLKSDVEGQAVDAYQYDILKAALEGPGSGNVVAKVHSLECESGLGADYFCKIGIGTDVAHPGPNNDETEAGYALGVRVYQGDVIFARLMLTAG